MKSRCVTLVLVAVVACTGCDLDADDRQSIGRSPRPSPGQAGHPPLKIGVVGTMTGPEGWRGEDAFEGADLGVHILNRGVGENEARYELEVLDDGGDAVRSLDLLRNLVSRGETVGVVYAGPPGTLVDAAELLRRARTPAFLCFGDLYGAQQLSSHLFQASPPYTWQARDIARYLTRDRRYERVGVLAEDSSLDGSVAARAAESALRGYGIERPAVVFYQADVRAALQRLRERRVEAVVLQGGPAALERIYAGLASLGARYRGTPAARVASAPNRLRRKRVRTGWWRPQLAGFDVMINDRVAPPPAGTVATASYARGVDYLPIPSFQRFRSAFKDWWDADPHGYELRAYEATLALGWAAQRSEGDRVAAALEGLRGRRFGGLPVTLGPDDHVTTEEVTIGLWTVPDDSDRIRERDRLSLDLPWVPLARGFSIDGETTDILSADWKWLFRKAPPRGGPAPRFTRMRFGVTTRRFDPLH